MFSQRYGPTMGYDSRTAWRDGDLEVHASRRSFPGLGRLMPRAARIRGNEG
ncbi:hypothetical protein [Brachybacterium hainanense]|uniref:Uncharacterized protein n=1 Tax=Brachybacterium hainanense TaxID=1541174 RepID=A0ABV6RB69_9MICO